MSDSTALTAGPKVIDLDTQPTIRRKFQYVSLVGNNNKWWMIEATPSGGQYYHVKVSYAREGQECARPFAYTWTLGQIEAKIAEKQKPDRVRDRGAYKEIDLHQVTAAPAPVTAATGVLVAPAAAPVMDAKVEQLIRWIFQEAGEAIKSFLKASVKVESLSRGCIGEGRLLLRMIEQMSSQRLELEITALANQENRLSAGDKPAIAANATSGSADFRALMRKVEEFYTVIPTQLPGKIRPVATVREFLSILKPTDLGNGNVGTSELYDRLDQLEAALTMVGVSSDSATGTQYNALGATITRIDASHPHYAVLLNGFNDKSDTYRHFSAMQLGDIFAVNIPRERARFDACTRGASNVKIRWHGSQTRNVRHILNGGAPSGGGLIIPRNYTNGWAFGAGIYLASQSQKSQQYCGTTRNYGHTADGASPKMLFAVDAKLGNQFKPKRADSSLVVPAGYDSVHADPALISTLHNDEFIVPTADQCTIRYILTFRD